MGRKIVVISTAGAAFGTKFRGLGGSVRQFPRIFPVARSVRVACRNISHLIVLSHCSCGSSAGRALSRKSLIVLAIGRSPGCPTQKANAVLSVGLGRRATHVEISTRCRRGVSSFRIRRNNVIAHQVLALSGPLRLFCRRVTVHGTRNLTRMRVAPRLHRRTFLGFCRRRGTLGFVPTKHILCNTKSNASIACFGYCIVPFIPSSHNNVSSRHGGIVRVVDHNNNINSGNSALHPHRAVMGNIGNHSSKSIS